MLNKTLPMADNGVDYHFIDVFDNNMTGGGGERTEFDPLLREGLWMSSHVHIARLCPSFIRWELGFVVFPLWFQSSPFGRIRSEFPLPLKATNSSLGSQGLWVCGFMGTEVPVTHSSPCPYIHSCITTNKFLVGQVLARTCSTQNILSII